MLDSKLRIQRINPAFTAMFRLAKSEAEGQLFCELPGGQWNVPELHNLLEHIVPQHTQFENFEVLYDFGEAGKKRLHLSGRRISGSDKRPALILLAIQSADEPSNSSGANA